MARALFSLRALFGAMWIHSYYTRMASFIRTRQRDLIMTRSRYFRREKKPLGTAVPQDINLVPTCAPSGLEPPNHILAWGATV